MQMDNLKQFVLARLEQSIGDLSQIAEKTSIPYPTLLKIHQRVIKNPGVDHMQTLYNFFKSYP